MAFSDLALGSTEWGPLELFGHLQNPTQVGFSKWPALSLGAMAPSSAFGGTMAQLFPPATASGRLRAQSHLRGAVGHAPLDDFRFSRGPSWVGTWVT